MSNPLTALNKLQEALTVRAIQLSPCARYPHLQVIVDCPNGRARFTYAQIQNNQVQAITSFVRAGEIEGYACFQIGYAVIEPMRGRGRAMQLAQQALDEFTHGFKATPAKGFYLEAIVPQNNSASQQIAKRLISEAPKLIQDQFSDAPALQYLRKIQLKQTSS